MNYVCGATRCGWRGWAGGLEGWAAIGWTGLDWDPMVWARQELGGDRRGSAGWTAMSALNDFVPHGLYLVFKNCKYMTCRAHRLEEGEPGPGQKRFWRTSVRLKYLRD